MDDFRHLEQEIAVGIGTVNLVGPIPLAPPRRSAVGWDEDTRPRPYAGYRFPAEIIGHAVWLYFRFPLVSAW